MVKKVVPKLRELASATRGSEEAESRNLEPIILTPPRFLSLITSSKFPPRDDGRFAKAASLAFTAARRRHCPFRSLAYLLLGLGAISLGLVSALERVGIISARPRSGTNVAENMHCVVTFSLSFKRCKSGLLN